MATAGMKTTGPFDSTSTASSTSTPMLIGGDDRQAVQRAAGQRPPVDLDDRADRDWALDLDRLTTTPTRRVRTATAGRACRG